MILACICFVLYSVCLSLLAAKAGKDRDRITSLETERDLQSRKLDGLANQITTMALEVARLKEYADAFEQLAEDERRYEEGVANINSYDISVAMNADKNGR